MSKRDDDIEFALVAVRRLMIEEARKLMHWHERQAARYRAWLVKHEPPIDNGPPDPVLEPELQAERRRRQKR